MCFSSACVSWYVRLFLEYVFLGLHVFLCVPLSARMSIGVYVFLNICLSRCMCLHKIVSLGMNVSRYNNYALIVNTIELVCVVPVQHISAQQ